MKKRLLAVLLSACMLAAAVPYPVLAADTAAASTEETGTESAAEEESFPEEETAGEGEPETDSEEPAQEAGIQEKSDAADDAASSDTTVESAEASDTQEGEERAYAGVTLYWPVPGHTSLSQGLHGGNAIDISDGSINGATVIAAIGGTVTHIFLCGSQHYGSDHDCHGFGTGLVISGDDGRIYQYAHMQGGSIPSNVYHGARVEAGQVIGKVGSTGNATGPHLHFGIAIGNYWNESGINPANETYRYDNPSAHTHSYTARSEVIKQATCTASGTRRSYCSCGQYQDSTIPALGHSYTARVIAPTLTEQGYTIHVCSRCGNTYKDHYVNPPQKGSDGWYQSDSLPSGIDLNNYDIQYKNHYVRQQETSPGAGWVRGAQSVSYVNDGGEYEEYTTVNTSDTKVLVRYYYFHFCSRNTGKRVNYAFTNTYNHWDSITSNVGAYTVTSQGTDDDSTNIPYYILNKYCQSGDTCDGSYGTHGQRSNIWYRMNVYQNRRKVVTYQYTKDSDWTSQRDSSASSVKIRFKEKTAAPTGQKFSDVPSSNAYYNAVNWAVTKGITTGYSNGTFGVSKNCSRGAFVTFLWRQQGSPEPKLTAAQSGLKDFGSIGKSYQKAVLWAIEKGITTGYGDHTFRAGANVTRGAAVTFLWRAAGKPKVSITRKDVSFTDMVPAGSSYETGILWAVSNKITTGYKNNTFRPANNCTRGATVTFLKRFDDLK